MKEKIDYGKMILDELKSGGADHAAVTVYEGSSKYFKIFDNQVDSAVEINSSGASIFTVKDKRVMFTNIERLEEQPIKAAVADALARAQMLSQKDYYFGLAEGPFKYGKAPGNDDKIIGRDYDVEDLTSGMINAALANGAEKVHGMFNVNYGKTRLLTTGNVDVQEEGTSAKCSIRVFTQSNTSAQNAQVSRKLSGIDFEQLGKETASLARMSSNRGSIENGTYDLIYMPIAAGNLLSIYGSFATIGSVEAGLSSLVGKLGKKVANPSISIYDDATISDGIQSYVFDDEGTPSQRTTIVKDGILKTYLHNASTAKKYKTKSTGNAGLLAPSTSTPVFEHKKKYPSIEPLIRDTRKGILITNVWYTRFSNYLTGAFSTMPRDVAFYIEDGEIRFAINMGMKGSASTGIRINDDFQRMLENTTATAGTAVQAKGWDASTAVVTPSLFVKDVKVTAASFK